MMKVQQYNIFVGSASGVFKGVAAYEKKDLVVKNLDNVRGATNKNPITALSWADKEQEEILIGYGNQQVKLYNTRTRAITLLDELVRAGDGPIVGLGRRHGAVVTGVGSGLVRCWRPGAEPSSIDVTAPIDRMVLAEPSGVVATGGRENDLKLWDLETGQQLFAAKNVRHDSLDMRVPVWVTDIAFLPDSSKVAVTSRHGHVRLYDPASPARRPVVSVTVPEQALTALACAPIKPQHVVVGSGSGQVNLVDLRGHGVVMNKYKGALGAVRSIACPEDQPFVVSVSLDRHLRLHHFSTKELIFKEYMQSKLTGVLVRRDLDLQEPAPGSGPPSPPSPDSPDDCPEPEPDEGPDESEDAPEPPDSRLPDKRPYPPHKGSPNPRKRPKP